MTCSAKLVVIMGTQYYDGTGLGASDYPVTDLLQMLGRASRPGVDEVGRLQALNLRALCSFAALLRSQGLCSAATCQARVVLVMSGRAVSGPSAWPAGDPTCVMACCVLLLLLLLQVGKCVLMCAAPRKEYYKKFLFEPLPIESHLDHFLHDTFNAGEAQGWLSHQGWRTRPEFRVHGCGVARAWLVCSCCVVWAVLQCVLLT